MRMAQLFVYELQDTDYTDPVTTDEMLLRSCYYNVDLTFEESRPEHAIATNGKGQKVAALGTFDDFPLKITVDDQDRPIIVIHGCTIIPWKETVNGFADWVLYQNLVDEESVPRISDL